MCIVLGLLSLNQLGWEREAWDQVSSAAQLYQSDDRYLDKYKEVEALADKRKSTAQLVGFIAFGAIIMGGGILVGSLLFGRKTGPVPGTHPGWRLQVPGLMLIVFGLFWLIQWRNSQAWDQASSAVHHFYRSDDRNRDKYDKKSEALADKRKSATQVMGFIAFGAIIMGGGILVGSLLFGRKTGPEPGTHSGGAAQIPPGGST
jgi:hypothetical protein